MDFKFKPAKLMRRPLRSFIKDAPTEKQLQAAHDRKYLTVLALRRMIAEGQQ